MDSSARFTLHTALLKYHTTVSGVLHGSKDILQLFDYLNRSCHSGCRPMDPRIKHFLLRIYSVIKRGRFFLEELRPEIQQYFVESNIDGQPFAREFRSVVYQRAKGDRDTVPFSTERGIDRVGYEWTTHSLAPRDIPEKESRLRVGGGECSHPYECLPI